MVWKAELRKSIRPRDEITVYSSDSILERNAYCDRGPTGAEGAGGSSGKPREDGSGPPVRGWRGQGRGQGQGGQVPFNGVGPPSAVTVGTFP